MYHRDSTQCSVTTLRGGKGWGGSRRRGYMYVVQLPSQVGLFETPWTAACQASLYLTISQNLPKFMFTASVMLSSYLILWYPLLLLPLIFPSIRDFSSESSVHIRDQNTGTSVLPSVPPVNIKGWSPLIFTGLISLLSKRLSKVFSRITFFEDINSLVFCLLYSPALTTIYDHWEDHCLDYMDLCRQNNA